MARRRFRTLFGVTLSLTCGAMTAHAADNVLRLRAAQVEPLKFSELNGWNADNQAEAFASFLKSCRAIRGRSAPNRAALPVTAGLYDVCGRALAAAQAGAVNARAARAFFENNFEPMRIVPIGEPNGFFTGYYETEIEGSRTRTAEYNVPLYKVPPGPLASADRTTIEEGALAGQGLELCWVKNPVDAFFAQIQGSARVKLAGGEMMRIGYAARNGLPYTPVGKFLIERGIYSKEEMSMDKIRSFMEANPDEGRELRRKNRSYVFFRELPLERGEHSNGGQGVSLTPMRSVAVDKSIHSYGTPIWIEADLPIETEKPLTPFRHLAIAQDTGTAIVGPARADIFFGSGEEIGLIAGRVKQFGKFVMLAPKGVSVVGSAASVPTPKPRP